MGPMASALGSRDFDVVLFGATGFTGGLTADYLASVAADHPGLRWALAGRSLERLQGVRDRLTGIDPTLADLDLLVVDADDEVGLAEIARRTRVVATTVGPFLQYGQPLVAACAEAGTDYVDLTGEPEFVDRVYTAHHQTALASGARLVHACGFDSIPHDLGAWWTVQQLPDDVPITLRGVVRAGGTFSGGTLHSALGQFARRGDAKSAAQARRAAEERPVGRSSRAVAGKPRRDPELGYWLLPMPTIDPLVVARSGAALSSYGPKFRYSHYAGTKTLHWAAGGAVAVTGIAVAAQIRPLRRLIGSRVSPGDGPDEARRAKSWFTVDFVAEAAGQTLHTRVSGGDPGYNETAKMLSESALSLAYDDNPETSGQVTTAHAMGARLTDRLIERGIRFDTL